MANDVKLKCYAGGMSSEPNFSTGVDMNGWDTASAMTVDLAWMAQSNLVSYLIVYLVIGFMIVTV